MTVQPTSKPWLAARSLDPAGLDEQKRRLLRGVRPLVTKQHHAGAWVYSCRHEFFGGIVIQGYGTTPEEAYAAWFNNGMSKGSV